MSPEERAKRERQVLDHVDQLIEQAAITLAHAVLIGHEVFGSDSWTAVLDCLDRAVRIIRERQPEP